VAAFPHIHAVTRKSLRRGEPRIVFDTISKTELSEMPNAVYSNLNDITSSIKSAKRPSEVSINIYGPADGAYRIVVNGQRP
jgi:hypothetical protein